MTTPNPIEEIKATPHQLGADAAFDIHRIFADLRNVQACSSRSYVDLPPRRTTRCNGAAVRTFLAMMNQLPLPADHERSVAKAL